MTENRLVSVIVPVYNGESFLTECIESVRHQTYPHWELIVVDDGSTDRTPEILKNMSQNDSRIRVVRTANSGVSAARNRGMDEAKGDFLTFLDADDCLVENALEVMLFRIGDSDIISGQHTTQMQSQYTPDNIYIYIYIYQVVRYGRGKRLCAGILRMILLPILFGESCFTVIPLIKYGFARSSAGMKTVALFANACVNADR